jgi:hypothetical protein
MDKKQRDTPGIKANRFITEQGLGLFLIKPILDKPLGKKFKFIGITGTVGYITLPGITKINRKTDDQRHNNVQDEFGG